MNDPTSHNRPLSNAIPRRVRIIYTSYSDQIGNEEIDFNELITDDWFWFGKIDVLIALTFLLMLSNHFYINSLIDERRTPLSSTFDSIRLLVMVVILLAWAIQELWKYAAKRAALKNISKIIYANHQYGQLIKQVQKETLRALTKGTQHEQLTTP